ncbi:BlaI/MecI/CopY family transcriptional regulator [Blastopirellula sp. JC732]|uniref:BlaI/MecI/CopY family transcriptional regulator n=1 Tax=Blastopirellula sediminis TaxID=2894196 RepID=A0A9X1MMW0_9BACT|nr:BlaI/MecI/CopY family transcriptional regulator [Blastopirellula sediminis]MCC9606635.1 BlaI/MecI/CopY family transcriptional regulator [Blastopirellula sediminis]MCC9630068.1 BlaI/MecI/CopY family transcriptional regulator [Blastopirellula sediminis]
MPRPKQTTPTAGELEVLKILWDRGPSTVRDVMNELNQTRPRAYTSVMSLMNVMADKGLLLRKPEGRAFIYEAKRTRDKTLGGILHDVLGRAFGGSASSLVAHLLEESKPSSEELDAIRRTLEQYEDTDQAPGDG